MLHVTIPLKLLITHHAKLAVTVTCTLSMHQLQNIGQLLVHIVSEGCSLKAQFDKLPIVHQIVMGAPEHGWAYNR